MIKTEKGTNVYGEELTILRKTQKIGEKILLKEGFTDKYHNNTLIKDGIVAVYSPLCGYWVLK